jgi:hypothetical protein
MTASRATSGRIGATAATSGAVCPSPIRGKTAAATTASDHPKNDDGRATMLYGLILILVVLWVLGLATSYTLGGLIHILLVIAVVVFVMNMLAGRRA